MCMHTFLHTSLQIAGSSHDSPAVFEQAVKEAQYYIQDSAEGKFDGCTAKDIMKQVESLRPKSFTAQRFVREFFRCCVLMSWWASSSGRG